MTRRASFMPLDPEFLADIVCPVCRGELILRGEDRLVCTACRRGYPVRDEIPILLVDESTPEDLPTEAAPPE